MKTPFPETELDVKAGLINFRDVVGYLLRIGAKEQLPFFFDLAVFAFDRVKDTDHPPPPFESSVIEKLTRDAECVRCGVRLW